MPKERDAAVETPADGEFRTYEEWARLGPLPPFRCATFTDARGRRCVTHKDFLRAREEGAFPVRYHWERTAETRRPGES
ncbi:MAG TPA: hypothetical protein VJ770_07395 [Stellaceae bacterium]|nr:hypothetical protein [Stellaceae bacterium]